FFYPRPIVVPARPVVLAMARPRTPRRAFDFVAATLAKVHEAMPDAEIVHFDGSDFQAFGLPALEAMACGAVSVLTDAGGIREYARHEENCLLVAPRDTD